MAKKKEHKFELLAGDGLALDPGNMKTGWLIYRPDESTTGGMKISGFGDMSNRELRKNMAIARQTGVTKSCQLGVECPRPTGIPVAAEVMETLIEIGRFLQMWNGPWTYVFRGDVKYNLCETVKGIKDAHVRQAVIDRFGGDEIAVGGKKCPRCKGKGWYGTGRPTCESCKGRGWQTPPGPFYGAAGSHVFAAAGVACWCVDHEVTHHLIAGRQPTRKKANVS